MISRIYSCCRFQYIYLFSSINNCRKLRTQSFRYNCTGPQLQALESLTNRSLLQVKGEEASNFLQGLITNDMKYFDNGITNIYTLFLNIKGRVLYDSIIYKGHDSDSYYVECDTAIIDDLIKYLKTYRVRRKIDIESLTNKMKVWAMFDSALTTNDVISKFQITKLTLEGQIFPCGTLDNKASKLIDGIIIYKDPRIHKFSFRIISDSNVTKDKIIKHLTNNVLVDDKKSSNYRKFRYQLGIGEGVEDFPPGKALPLEINCDYLHGVSFHKGCYIGQELTARTHHTGVVRKRFMPLIFDEAVEKNFMYDENILDENDKVIGKFRNADGKHGIGLMRVSELMNAKKFIIQNCSLKVVRPCWWPRESLKERLKMDEG